MIEDIIVPIKHIIRHGSLKIFWKDEDIPIYKWLYDNVPGQSKFNKFGPNESNWLIIAHSIDDGTITIRFTDAPPEIVLMFKLMWGNLEDNN
jgi:hypothetical protein